MKTGFIGHRQVFTRDIRKRLCEAIQEEIDMGCTDFIMGAHGEFDKIALSACREARRIYNELKIEVVLTSQKNLNKIDEFDISPYSDVKTFMYDIEHAYYKQQIIVSNRKMIDECDTLICYVDTSVLRSGARRALQYAEKRGLKIVNLYRTGDNPYYGMTQSQIDEKWQSVSKKL